MKTSLNIFVNSCLLAATAIACSQAPVSIGDNQTTQLKTGLAAYAASWDGYVQAYKFPDGSDRVRLNITEDGKGTIQFGNSALLPKPTDPNVKFPPNFPQCSDCIMQSPSGIADGTNPLPGVWDGFAFTLNDIHVDTDRLRGTAAGKEIYKDWCQLQTAKHFTFGSTQDYYSCSACAGGIGSNGGALSDSCDVPDDNNCSYLAGWVQGSTTTATSATSLCERELLCTGTPATSAEVEQTCLCDANGCGIGTPAQNITLDAALSETQETITGTLALATKPFSTEATNYTIVLTRK